MNVICKRILINTYQIKSKRGEKLKNVKVNQTSFDFCSLLKKV